MAPGSEAGGCLNCYAARMAARNLPEMRSPTTGKQFAVLRDSGPRWTGDVELIEAKLQEPLHWRKPRRVFVNSMSDLFHESLPDADILSVFQAMGKCPAHTFQILTKRPERMLEFLRRRHWRNLGHSPAMGGDHYVSLAIDEPKFTYEHDPAFLPNVWLGVSVEDQPTADARIALLLQTPAALRFVSYEPALGPVDFLSLDIGHRTKLSALTGWQETHHNSREITDVRIPSGYKGIDWLIVGGESGPGARPFDLAWARSARDQCAAAGTAFFMKQAGAKPVALCTRCSSNNAGFCRMYGATPQQDGFRGHDIDRLLPLILHDRKGGTMEEWPPDIRVRQFPEAR
jgi:protein gp37